MHVSTKPAETGEIQSRRLSGALGVEIRGIDITALGDGDLEFIHQALIDHHVVVLRDQDTEVGNVDAFAKRFGPKLEFTGEVRSRLAHPQYPDVIVIENKGYTKAYTNSWHSDTSYADITPGVSILGAYKIPEAGGDTQFANQHLAYEALSPAFQEMLKPLRAEHAVHLTHDEGTTKNSAVHPVVRTHPATGRKALYLNETFNRKFVGMSQEESQGLLGYLLDHSVRPEFSYRHRYEQGDVVLWDNRSVVHRATQDYREEERVMYHLEVMPEEPA